uniref:RRM domain-containing protein n=1 Tax=Ananas comosus var. bracteatus TaxID=296719 RepID=A0A6V7P1N0_ANACO|nr:unnamed protein product [Ananas comosus var. bracteatus]
MDRSMGARGYVGNVHVQVTEALLQEVFQSTGPVEGCKLIRKEKSSFGFVDYYDPGSVALAIMTLNGRHLKANNLALILFVAVVCDPVMGDEGKLYVPQELVSVPREKLSGENETHVVEVEATAKEPGTPLRAPTKEGGLVTACKDTCFGDLRLQIWERSNDVASRPGSEQKASPGWDPVKLALMPMMALALDPSGSPTGSGAPGRTSNIYPDCVGTAVVDEDHCRSRSMEPVDGPIHHAG